jgi:beta-glucosidase
MKPFRLPDDFKMGTATASLQIEGGDRGNSWYRWTQQAGRIKDGTDCLVAADHWNRVAEDTRIMKGLGVNAYRLSLEWSRIEPSEGKFDVAAIDHYRNEIKRLRKAGIEPMVTLHHFSNPLWFEDSGGWTEDTAITRFERYTEHAVRELGDLVSTWVTINEPNVYLLFGYVTGTWPPGEKNITRFIRGARVMIRAHIASYRKIHEIRKNLGFSDTKVGVAHHLRIFDPMHGTAGERFACFLQNRLFHDIFVTGMSEGRYLLPLGTGYPLGKGTFQDFFGINYYSREMVSFNPRRPDQMFGDISTREGAPVNDLGWEIYPEGLYRFCEHYYRRFSIPIYITENGTSDAKDSFRTQYIYDHLYQVKLLIDAGVDVRGYYHWSFMDNFEWAEGLEPRFGLVAVDYRKQKRTVRQSGKFYTDICKNKGVTESMIRKYLP